MALELRSTAFGKGEMIPSPHTCDGRNVSPPLTWQGVPEKAVSLALILEDIDSVEGTWSHWVVFDLPPSVNGLPEGVPPRTHLSQGGVHGLNDFGEIGYGGPCPSDGKAHRYFFRLYAVDASLGLEAGVTRTEVLQAVEGHVVEEAHLAGRYARLADR